MWESYGEKGQPSYTLLAEAKPKIQARSSKALYSMVWTGDDLLRSQRTLIERSFECGLYNRYGLREISGYIARECKAQQGLHINVEHVTGILSANPCTYVIMRPLLQVVQGRQGDYVAFKDGTRIHLGIIADSFLHHFFRRILQVQFVEHEKGFMTVHMVPQDRLTHTDMTEVRAYLSKLFSSFDVKFMHDLPSDTFGKTPLLVRKDREGS
jgi:phenylacetate-coenzyme A ligase PaaK-like adenylate-forming protein